jgi:hypothetical protein
MAKGKTSFVLYSDNKSIIDLMTNEQAGLLLKTLFAYVNDEDPVIDNSIAIVFEMIKLQLKRDLVKWEQTKEGRSIAGKASAEAKRLVKLSQQTSTNSTNVDFVQQTSTNSTVSDSVSVSVSDSVSVISNKKPRTNKFVPPTQDEVLNYFIENGYSSYSGTKAFKYYHTGDWKDSSGKQVRNWKQKMQSVWFKEENLIKDNTRSKESLPDNIYRNSEGMLKMKTPF